MTQRIPAGYVHHLPHPPKPYDETTKETLAAIDAAREIWQSVDSPFSREMLAALSRERLHWTRGITQKTVEEIREELMEEAA